MELVLWRHADAESGEPDLRRKLTAKGEKQAQRVAKWLQVHLPHNAQIYVSPATRAQQTALALADISHHKLRTVEELGPDTSVARVLGAVGWPVAKSTIVVVGHQPTLGLVASELLSGRQQEWSIKKGGVWWLSQRENEADEVMLRAVVNPDLL